MISSTIVHGHSTRNIAVISHVDHGKSTLTEYLLRKAGSTSKNDESCFIGAEVQLFDCNIKSNCINLCFNHSLESADNEKAGSFGDIKSYSVNVIGSPSNVDFSCEALVPSLMMADGSLIVVDCIEGVGMQTDVLLRQAMHLRIQPCLMINKLDRALMELQLTGEEIYQLMFRIVGDVNSIIESCQLPGRDWRISPVKGNVVLGSGLHQWGFSLKTFAKAYAGKFNTTEKKMTEKLWGDWVFHTTADGKSSWINSTSVNANRGVDRETGAKRAFVAFILDPIISLYQATMNNELTKKGTPKAHNMTAAVGVNLSEEVKKTMTGKPLLNYILQQWLPAAEAMLEMIVVHLPSPATAQEYRCKTLYDGPLDDEAVTIIRTCDASEDAPMIMYLFKIHFSGNGHFAAFGRVLAGKITTGQKVRVFDPHSVPDSEASDRCETHLNVQGVLKIVGSTFQATTCVAGGDICGLTGYCDSLFENRGDTVLTMRSLVAVKR